MNNTNAQKLFYSPEIDGLRGVAVLGILFFHLGFAQFKGGFIGVDVFFVISGFLITKKIVDELENTGSFCFRNFYIRRIRRLFPALFVTLIATTFLSILFLSPAHLKSFGGALISSLTSVSNIYFWCEADYFDVSAKVKPLLHTWSLSVEEQFYLFWPLTLYILYGFKKRWAPWGAIFMVFCCSLCLCVMFSDGSVYFVNRFFPTFVSSLADGRSTIFFLIPFRVFEFAIGASLIWLGRIRMDSRLLSELFFICGIALICYALVFFNDEMLFPSYFALVPCVGAALIIFSRGKSVFSVCLSNRIFVGIGLISYSLYLVHWPIIVFTLYVKKDISPFEQIVMAIMSFTLAWLSYIFIECPFRYGKIKLNYNVLVGFVLLPLFVMAAMGLHMKENDGWAWRISSTLNFEDVGDAATFHKTFYGGAGYPRYGAVKTTRSPEVILVGDSHGRHYAEGIYKEWTEPEGKAFYIAAGSYFIHLPSFTRTTEGTDWERIVGNSMGRMLSFVHEASSPPVIVISHYWLNQMKKADLLGEDGRRQGIHVGVEEVVVGISILKQMVGDAKLVVVGQVPRPEYNLYDIFSRPRLPFFSNIKPDDYTKSPLNSEIKEFNRQLAMAANSTGAFIFLDPCDVLCVEGSCRNIDSKNHFLYSDGNHLSKYGSREVISAFLPRLRQIAQQ